MNERIEIMKLNSEYWFLGKASGYVGLDTKTRLEPKDKSTEFQYTGNSPRILARLA